jgi:CubicO group peptidase (beta-lactamase class C family)
LCVPVRNVLCVLGDVLQMTIKSLTIVTFMRKVFLPIVLSLALFLPAGAKLSRREEALQGPTSQTLSDSEISARLKAYLRPFVETGNFTGTVLVARKGHVVLREAYGLANYELKVPNTIETRFHLASVSKAFTAAAILQLQEQGRLNVSDHVSRFIQDFPHGDQITLDNLLTHTSGIPDINGIPGFDTFDQTPHTVQELVAKFADLPLLFAPGTSYSYSNSNYNLLALILEKVSGENYANYIRKHIFDQAEMERSGHDGTSLRSNSHIASGYDPAGVDGYQAAPYLDWSNKTGNGSLYSTVDDLYRFDRALNTDRILKAATRRKYFIEGEGNRYGWYIRTRLGHRVISGKGRSPGFAAELDRFPDDDLTIILLCNSFSSVSQDPIAEALAAIVFGGQPSPPAMRIATIAQSTLEAYTGAYQYGPDYFAPNAEFNISAKSGYLLMQLGDASIPLVPLSETDFLERRFFGHISMSKNGADKNGGLVTRYGEKDFAARRLETK